MANVKKAQKIRRGVFLTIFAIGVPETSVCYYIRTLYTINIIMNSQHR